MGPQWALVGAAWAATATVADTRPHPAVATSRECPMRIARLSTGALTAVLVSGALAAGAHAVPADPATRHAPARATRHVRPGRSRSPITFTNPLGRSRGPGAGGGLL